mmetsp:Transcript_14505/g.46942  ORF Transcript_14505/g.46942 Transcript_14505/m.46942 type:complete len:218 (-) Transcript_14505:54-707(-)
MSSSLLSLSLVALTPRATPPRMSDDDAFAQFEASYKRPAPTGFARPSTGGELREYLLGKWSIRKATVFSVGGISGRFQGVGEFVAYPHERPLLAYSERGVFTPDSGGAPVETRNRLMYDFSDERKVAVFFDPTEEARGDASSVVAALRFDHSIDPSTLQMADAPAPAGASEDEAGGYTGHLDIEAAGAFLSTWSVGSAANEGSILSMHSRAVDRDEL